MSLHPLDTTQFTFLITPVKGQERICANSQRMSLGSRRPSPVLVPAENTSGSPERRCRTHRARRCLVTEMELEGKNTLSAQVQQ